MRILAAEDRVNLDDFLLPLQRIKIVRHADQVHFRRQLVGRMAPVAVGEDAQPAGGECLDLVLHIGKVRGRVLVPLENDCASSAAFFGSALSAFTMSTQSSACRW